MPSMTQRKGAFRKRVNYAHKALLRDEDSRALDNCFEMYDGEFVVVALMRRAAIDDELRAAICRHFARAWLDLPWQTVFGRNASLSDAALETAAAYVQVEEEWAFVHIYMPQAAARRDPSCRPFRVIRREGPDERNEAFYAPSLRAVTQAVRSWHERTVQGQPFLSLLAQIQIRTPEGEIVSL